MRSAPAALLSAVLLVSACDSPTEPVQPADIAAAVTADLDATAGSLVPVAPAVRVADAAGRPVGGARVTFVVRAGGGSVAGGSVRTGSDGIARAAGWTLGVEPAFNVLAATVAGLPDAEVLFEAVGVPVDCPALVQLDFALGAFQRFESTGAAEFPCLRFDPRDAADEQYLILLENMPRFGPSDTALFPASTGAASDTGFSFELHSVVAAPSPSGSVSAATVQRLVAAPPPPAAHSWDFGAGRIYEYEPPAPQAGSGAARIHGASGALVDLNSAAADPQIGDTVFGLRLEGIARLGITTTNDNRAVIRHISDELIIAEDVRLGTTLTREGGGHNTPLPDVVLDSIALEYAAHASLQGDRLFDGRHNSAVEASVPARVLAVHTLMYADNIWGYTYSSTDFFAFDYWVGTNGSTRGLNQHPQRLADNLFTHEIAHMRHWGMLQRNGQPVRGNRWLVEGFARFSERLPIAARLLGTGTPSRTANVQLPLNPAFNGSYFRDDVPTYMNAGTPIGGGYQHSSYIFDYFADQVALSGGDWLSALRDFVVAAGRPTELDAVISDWLPEVGDTEELFTRARVALYADDLSTSQPACLDSVPPVPAPCESPGGRQCRGRPPQRVDAAGARQLDVDHRLGPGRRRRGLPDRWHHAHCGRRAVHLGRGRRHQRVPLDNARALKPRLR
ncbi:MAG: hypothetical protein WEF86_08965 [Gemmatimonadota bacterium]